MTEKRQLGAILLESGRITDADVQRVLEYQRAHGGFFGQGLVALGIVTREEIDWALASQFDIPFIFPNADAVDREAARVVPADWALAHMAVPIVKSGGSLTFVVADPLHRETIQELRARTGCEIEMALASATRIRELIHAVYDATQSERVEGAAALSLGDFLAQAVDRGAERFGISVRGNSAVAWWRSRGETHRAPLQDGWNSALGESLEPSVDDRIAGLTEGQVDWNPALRRAGSSVQLTARAMVGVGGYELMFRPSDEPPAAAAVTALPQTLVTELRLLWRSGSARVGVGASQPDLARSVLPLLPALALGEHVRAAHVNDSGSAVAGVYTLRAEGNDVFADDVASYELDAITIDLPITGYPVRALLRAAPLCFMILDEPEERSAPGEWGINWLLTILGQPGSYAWDLRALHR